MRTQAPLLEVKCGTPDHEPSKSSREKSRGGCPRHTASLSDASERALFSHGERTDEIRAFAAKRKGPAIPAKAAITDYEVRAFDLDYSSSPTIVLTAKLPVTGATVPAGFSYFATVVARVDINDQPQKLFASVTDTRHLDAFPRYELIDALDADANGRGDLLFRQYSDVGITYGLYRVSAYQLEKIFEGGSSL